MNRYYTISVTGGAFNASELRLEYLSLENINSIPDFNLALFSKDVQWLNRGGTKVVGSKAVFIGDVSTFSDWTIGDGLNPLPIQITSFTGTCVNSGVRLNWSTISEVNNYGFYLQNGRTGATEWSEVPNSFIAGHGTTNEPHSYSFTHNNVAGGQWQYRLKQVDLDGTVHFSEPINVTAVTSVKEVAPIEFALKQNYPNPLNPSTEIKFSVEQTGRATLRVYNMLGQLVATLFDDVVEAGYYQTVRFNGTNLASGVYLYRLQSGKKSDLKKLILLR